MDKLPQPIDESPSPLVRVAAFLFIPVALVLVLPVLLLLVLIVYLLALVNGARVCVTFVTGRKTEPEFEMQKPHFLDIDGTAQVLPDRTTSNSNEPEA